MSKKFVGEPFSVSLILGTEKVWIREGGGGVSRFSVEIFLSHSAEIFRRELLYCCNNFGYRGSLDKRERGVSRIWSKIFGLTVPKNFVGEFFTVAIFLGIEKVCIRGEGEYHNFPSKIFCLTVPKISVGNSFTVAKISGIEKVWIRERGEYQEFWSKIFCLKVPKSFIGEPFSVSLISGTEKVWITRGVGISRFSVEIFLSHSAETFRRGTFQFVTNFGYRKNLDNRGEGECQDFPSKTFCLTVPKIFVGELFSVSLISGTEKVWIIEGVGVSRFSVEFFLSHSAENFRRGVLCCCIISASEKVWIGGGGEYQDFPSKFFCLTVPKNFMGFPSLSQKLWGIEKLFAYKGVPQVFVENVWPHSA